MDKFTKKYSLPLTLKILLPLCIISLITVISGWILFKHQYMQEVEKQIERRAVSIANGIEQFSWIVGISPELTRVVDSLGAEKDIELLTIFQREPFQVVTVSGEELPTAQLEKMIHDNYYQDGEKILDAIKTGKSLRGSFLNSDQNDTDYVIVMPILLKEHNSSKLVPGAIYIQLEISDLLMNINHQIRQMMAWLITGILLMAGLIYWVLQRYVFESVKDIHNTINRRADGDISAYATLLHHDEIGDVGQALNTMLDRLEDSKRDVTHAREQAEQANASKSDFLANMSHEIRTPMNGVLGMTGLLLETELEPEQRGWAEIIKKSGENLLDIINDILDFSKIEAGKLTLEPIAFDVTATIMEVTDLLVLKTQEKGIELLVELAPDLPHHVIGDPTRLRQILLNLSGNAIKFTQKGHVLIRLKWREELDQKLRFFFEVEDTGTGIPTDKLSHIFEKFTQAEESTTRKFGGTGLGLAICDKLVGMMDGNISVRSKIGQGSTFSFDVALQRGEVPQNMIHQIPECDLTDLRVLVVDDSALHCAIASKYLTAWDMRCDICASADQALVMMQEAVLAGDPYRFALLDYRLEGTNGLQLAEWIQSSKVPLDATLFMITALGQVITSSKLGDKGFSGFLVKPFYPDQLKAALKILWNAKQKGESVALVTRHTIMQMMNSGTRQVTVRPDMFAGSKVLVVEDMKVNLMLITKILEKHGCIVSSAVNGKEAVAMVKKNRYDIVFMDCQMPEMDGFEATGKIRQFESKKKNLHTKIVALTADAMTGDREKCLAAGMDDYLNKPIRPEKVTVMLEKWLHT